jgi:hypothetical protein
MAKRGYMVKYSFELDAAAFAGEPDVSQLMGGSTPVVIDIERMKAALASNSHELPCGLGRAERRKRILAVANRRK